MANDRILSSAEDFEAAVAKFNNCKGELQNAYLQMTSAVFTLDSSWNGSASEAFKQRYNELYTNMKTSDGTIESAIKDIQMVAVGHEEVNTTISNIFSATSDTVDPFAAG